MVLRHHLSGHLRSTRRAQALVEFALILPILALLLVLAIDFGRVFFGFVGLHNVVRIAANDASIHPGDWEPPGNMSQQDRYRDTVLNDLASINCEPAGGGSWQAADIPDPVFEDMPNSFSAASPYELGDHAKVTISCEFSFITPLAGLILGSPIPITATAEFAVRGGEVLGIPIGPAPPPPTGCNDAVVPSGLIGLSVQAARDAWTNAGFDPGTFSPASGQDSETVTAWSTSPPANEGDCVPTTTTITVTSSSSGCTSPEVEVPNLETLTVAAARIQWTNLGFSGTFSPTTADGFDADVVTDQNTSPATNPGQCVDPSIMVSITVVHEAPQPTPPPQCPMPDLTGKKVNAGLTEWTSLGFSAANYYVSRPPNGNYTITSQQPVSVGQLIDCTEDVTVAGN